MKNLLLSGAILFAAFFVFGTVETAAQSEPTVGGYRKIETADPDVKAAVDFAIKQKGDNFGLIKIKRAERQVVAGVNFRVKMKISEKSGEKVSKYTVTAVIYHDLNEKYSVSSWERK